ncbi:MAG: alpha/beta hydrolase family protein [Oceanicaulis sp.]
MIPIRKPGAKPARRLAATLALTLATALSPIGADGAGFAHAAHAVEAAQPGAQSAFAAPGPHAVTTTLDTWRDEERGRDIPVKLYRPGGAGPFPAVIFSHGLGGSRDAAPYLGAHLASWGFVAVHIQHPGSDTAIWEGARNRRALMEAMQRAVRDPGATIDRFQDIPFVVDAIEARAASLDIDPERLGVAGHSFGAHTVMAASGFTFLTGRGGQSMAEPRLSAGLLLSPPAPNDRIDPSDYPEVYGSVAIPLLHITGVDDGSPLDRTLDPAERTIAFREIDDAPQYLIVFDPGDHQVFSGREGRRAQPDWYPGVQAATAQAAAAFFRAELYGDPDARAFMDGPAFDAAFEDLAQTDRRR